MAILNLRVIRADLNPTPQHGRKPRVSDSLADKKVRTTATRSASAIHQGNAEAEPCFAPPAAPRSRRSRFQRLVCVAAALAGLAGCGTQGDATVLPDRWPRSGLSGYRFLDADVPYALGRFGWDLDEPTALGPTQPVAAMTDASIQVWGRMSPRLSPEKTVLFRATLSNQKLNAEAEPDEVLGPTMPWEADGLRSPSVLPWRDDGSRLLLLYQGTHGDVGAAAVTADGIDKLSTTQPLFSAQTLRAGTAASVGRVSAVRDDDRLYLFYTLDERELRVAEASVAALVHWAEAGGGDVALRISPPLLQASAVGVPPGESKAVPAERISHVAARRLVTPVGRVRWDVALRAQAGRDTVLVAASAYAEAPNPSQIGPAAAFLAVEAPLIKTSEGTVGAPALATLGSQALLFFGLRSVGSQVAVAALPQ